MEKKICEICGYEGNPKDLVIRRIAPGKVDRQAGIFDIRTVLLCTNCSNEWYSFCSQKVHDVNYDDLTKHFMPKSSTELIKEYEVAYKAFIAYKKKPRDNISQERKRKR
ncbi:hypothetical protein ACFLYI_02375 [Chloroflexota bacterium]